MAGLVMLGALAGIPSAPAGAAVAGKFAPASGRLLGLSINNVGSIGPDVYKNAVARREIDAGRRLDLLATMRYGFTNTWPTWRETYMSDSGHIPVVNWAGGYAPAIANGSKDSIVAARADAAKAYGKPLFVRYAAGMDTSSEAASTVSASSFIAAWRRVHSTFAARSVTNVAWVWCPSAAGWSSAQAAQYWPGDAYVDWVCADGSNTGSPWVGFTAMFRPFVDAAAGYGKPLMIGSFGSVEGTVGQKAQWVEWAYAALANTFPTVLAALYEDTGTTSLSTSSSAASTFSSWSRNAKLYTATTPATVTGKFTPPGAGAYLGTYQPAGTQAAEQAEIQAFEARMGRQEAIAHTFYSWNTTFPTWREDWHLAEGRLPMVSWGGTNTTDVANGVHDPLIRTRARGLQALGGPVLLRWFWEMDGAANATVAVSPAEYIRAWTRIHSIFQQEGATNVAFVWSPNAWGIQQGTAQAFYPGDGFVDWIAADGYNWYPGRSGSPEQSFTTVFASFYAWASTKAKPLMIAETGTEESTVAGGKAQWIRDMGVSLRVHFPRVRALVYFDSAATSYTDGSTLFNWGLDGNTSASDAWKAIAADPYLAPMRG